MIHKYKNCPPLHISESPTGIVMLTTQTWLEKLIHCLVHARKGDGNEAAYLYINYLTDN